MGRITDTVKVLLIINVIFFIGSQMIGDTAYEYLALWFFKHPNFEFWQPVTHMFMHGGFMHILFNMYALWAFGSPIEQYLGQKRFIFFYFSAGLGAALLHTLVNLLAYQNGYNDLIAIGWTPAEITEFISQAYSNNKFPVPAGTDEDTLRSMLSAFGNPAVGASGAIYGVLVAFGMLFPNVELFLLFVPVPIKAKYFIPGLIAIDLFSGFTGHSLFGESIAHFAHIGGALFGFIMMYYWKKNQFNDKRWD
ncbi:rhomboid family intramembrane serine protease [Gramella sp. AN32]|uniref:Rhomboid family intramembrane serine protease n=1 Tax=Christiangramia antarctica TaxID=2058158 RepID=A0ABW5XAS4_9FLAO|nr:rhomboid family intramembrane serine protease [Gramella sp. AN32]MCM4154442.1 rhomboid family intramembrane serine protease [Gramella sp. AN32]